MNATTERRPAEVFRPGEYVAEAMDAEGWSVDTLAHKSGIDPAILTELLERDYPMTDELAAGLRRAFRTSAVLWTNLDRAWQGKGPARPRRRR